MNQSKKYLGFLVLSVACFAMDTIPFAGQIRGVDKLFKVTVSGPDALQALSALEQVANGHPENVEPALASLAGITQAPDELSWFRSSIVRVQAMHRIGETGRPETIAYLSGVTAADFESDTTRQIWPASQVALQQAVLLNIGGRQQKIEFLEKLLRESGGYLASFAEDELCSMGSLPSLGLITTSIRAGYSGQYGEEQVRFAEARLRAVTSDPDRAKALASALKISSNQEDERLTQWAIARLVSMNTPDADAELDRFSAAIARLPAQSAERQALGVLPEEIRRLRAER